MPTRPLPPAATAAVSKAGRGTQVLPLACDPHTRPLPSDTEATGSAFHSGNDPEPDMA